MNRVSPPVLDLRGLGLTELEPGHSRPMVMCSGNRLTRLHMDSQLTHMVCGNLLGYCHRNQISEIPAYPRLEWLYCGDMGLDKLPEFRELTYLGCNDNNLRSLPSYPRLEQLYCGNLLGGTNQFDELPPYPNLRVLSAPNVGIESLPYYPNLMVIDLTGNPIAEMMDDPTDAGEYRKLANCRPRPKSARSSLGKKCLDF